MNLKKICWGIRAIIYKFKFKTIKFPSYIGKPLLIENARKISFGSRCRIYPGLRAEIVTENSYLTIGNNVSIGQNFHVVSYESDLVIGNNVTISGNVFITNCSHSYEKLGEHILDQPIIPQKIIQFP